MVILLLCLSVVFAQNETAGNANITVAPVSDETNDTSIEEAINENELKPMVSPEGVVYRFLQLERQIEIKILRGGIVIERIQFLNDSVSVEELQAILEELELVKEEVNEYTNESSVTNISEAIIAFVDLKRESLDLVKEFRNKVHEILDQNEIQTLRTRIRSEVTENSVPGVTQRIKAKLNAFNAQRVRNALQNIGVNESLIEQVRNGNITKSQVTAWIKNKYKNLNPSVKNQVKVEIRQRLTQNNISVNNAVSIAKVNATVRKVERLQNRIEKLENQTSNLSNAINNIKNRITSKRNKAAGVSVNE